MRISEKQAQVIRKAAVTHFGSSLRVWLFGSRVDDHLAGGDIDLYVEPDIEDAAELVEAKLHFLEDIHQVLGEQKIHVVIKRPGFKGDLPIYKIAKETGISLT